VKQGRATGAGTRRRRAGGREGIAVGGALGLRCFGRVGDLTGAERRSLLDRATSSDEAIRARTAEIIARVRRDGDRALVELARELDGVRLARLEVERRRRSKAVEDLDPAVRRAMERAAANIETAHRAFLPRPTEVETEPGVVVGRRPDALESVGVYAPGGRASYPSSVLMGAIPARVAGVPQVILCSPPGPDGVPAPAVLAAAEIARVDRVFAVGGAGAIAAMAYGTATVPSVSRIVGPGNAYVAEAKLQVAGVVAIDSPAGPSELLVVADGGADPALVAREVLAQAEHDPMAACVVVTTDERVARRIVGALAAALPSQERREIVAQSLARHGAVLWGDSLGGALDFAREYAPEHLLLVVEDADAALGAVRNAGTVFLGAASSVAFGDYVTGANHVLPTGRAARAYSGLSTLDFVRWTTYQRVSPDAAARLAADAAVFADAERLSGHAAAVRAWGGRTTAPPPANATAEAAAGPRAREITGGRAR
jgi:histidinol dehydrogenase